MAVLVALTIACIGIFGLSSFMVSKRTKEVGIRRVLGSHTTSIISLLAKPFILMVAIANVMGWPVAYLLIDQWLANFEYAVAIDWLVFVVASLITFVLTIGVTSCHALKVSKLNPVDSLRSE